MFAEATWIEDGRQGSERETGTWTKFTTHEAKKAYNGSFPFPESWTEI